MTPRPTTFAIRRALAAGPMTTSGLADRIGLTAEATRVACTKLQAAGELASERGWCAQPGRPPLVWHLADRRPAGDRSLVLEAHRNARIVGWWR